jgi:tetratricopeptide (TPR) repeat protein
MNIRGHRGLRVNCIVVAMLTAALDVANSQGKSMFRGQIIKDIGEVCARPSAQSDHWSVSKTDETHFGSLAAAPATVLPQVDVVLSKITDRESRATFTLDEWSGVQDTLATAQRDGTPDSANWCREHLTPLFLTKFDNFEVVRFENAYKLVAQGYLGEALKTYQPDMPIAARVPAGELSINDWRRDRLMSGNNDGKVPVAKAGSEDLLPAAIVDLLPAQEYAQYRAERYAKEGEAHAAKGDIDSALKAFQEVVTIRTKLAAGDAYDSQWQQRQLELSSSYEKVGDVDAANGNSARALASYKEVLRIRTSLAASAPHNTEWQSKLLMAYERVGDTLAALGDNSGALRSFQAVITILERPGATDPKMLDEQSQLSATYTKLGDVQAKQGDSGAALGSYQAALAILERLTTGDPRNTQLMRDLSVTHNRIGDLQSMLGDKSAAASSYQTALGIRSRLAVADPHNAPRQRDLSVSYNRLGDAQAALGDYKGAIKSYQAGLAIARVEGRSKSQLSYALEKFVNGGPLDPEWQRDLSVSYNKVGDMQG